MIKYKKRLFEIIQTAEKGDTVSKIFDIGILSLIVINVIAVIAATFDTPQWLSDVFYIVEIVSVIIFTIEYVLRLYTSDLLYPDIPPYKARIKYILSFMAIVDLLAILPFYLPFLIPVDLRVLRMIRIIRLFRIFKVNRYTSALSDIAQVLVRKKAQLLSSVFVVGLLMIIAAVLMYNVENEAQPDQFSNAFSALWWAIATVTTVGYGDIYPVTTVGKALSAIIAVLGIGLVAVPTGIISAGFMETIEHDDNNDKDDLSYCPYCGKKLH